MTIVHSGEGYKLCNRRRPKDLALIKAKTKKIFDIPEAGLRNSLPHDMR